jgi:endonuclease YncB( thermonuclease family)
MTKAIQKNAYQKLVSDISTLYESARKTLVKTYWEIGRRIVEVESPGAEYGDHVIDRLSKDLSKKYGEGFSRKNLYRMKQLYIEHPKVSTLTLLDWSKQVELMSVEDNETREDLERKAVKENLSARDVRELVREEQEYVNARSRLSASLRPGRQELQYTRGELYVFGIVDPAVANTPKGFVTVDCGFNLWHVIEKKKLAAHKYLCIPFFQIKQRDRVEKEPSYMYAATVEQVIDGDTLWVRIDCGFNVILREKVRLRGIDAAEVASAEGKRAKVFVERRLPKDAQVVIHTMKSDKYDRYLADLFYGTRSAVDSLRSIVHGESAKIAKEGTFLNQELLDNGLAVVFEE